ncbi:MAG TPA: NAD(P)-dependent oxidoreductase [Acidimicrobiia bacterium]
MPNLSASDVGKANAARSTIVTGAAGWLGKNLVRTLASAGGRVRCLVNDRDEAALLEVISPRIEVTVGDLRDPVAVTRLFEEGGGATVFHAGAVIHPRSRTREIFDVNVGGTEHVLDRARRAGVERLVFVSSNSPFGANPTPFDRFTEDSPYNPYLSYGASKREAEQLVFRTHERGDVDCVVVRAPWFYGPFQPDRQSTFFAAIRRGRFPLVGPGTQQRSMVYTGNLVDGLLLAASVPEASGRAYWIADADPYPLREILLTVRHALVAEGLEVTSFEPRIPRAGAQLAAAADAFLQGRGRYVQALHVLGELKDTIACDIGRARKELGYDPAVGLLEGMRASIRWCVAHGQSI